MSENNSLDRILPSVPLPKETIDKALELSFKAKDGSSAESIIKEFQEKTQGLKRGRPKKNMALPSLKNLQQYSDKPVPKEQKKEKLDGLRVAPKKQETLDQLTKFPEGLNPPEGFKNPNKLLYIFTNDELIEFCDIWKRYWEEMGSDLDDGSDYDDLFELCVQYIELYRLAKKKATAPGLVFDDKVDKIAHNVHLRIQNLKTALKMRRKDRLESGKTDEKNFIALICDRASKGSEFIEKSRQLIRQQEEEEMEFLRKKDHAPTNSLPQS